MDKKKALMKQLQDFMRNIAPEYPLKEVILFGSQATGKARKDSDIDLLIVSEKFRGKEKLDRSPDLYLKWDLDYPVDFLCYTPEEFQRKKKQIGIVQQAVREGVTLAAG